MRMTKIPHTLTEYVATIDRARRSSSEYIGLLSSAAYKLIYTHCDRGANERPYHLPIHEQAILFELILAAKRTEECTIQSDLF